jgi:hypothetical protein
VFLGLRWTRAALLTAAVLLTVGCGLSDYEYRMNQEQERLDYLEEEARYLGDPVQLPPPKEGKKGAKKDEDVFFRPPRGISDKADSKQPPGSMLISFPAGRNSKFKDVQMVVSKGKKSVEDFRKEVMLPFGGVRQTKRITVEHKASHRPQDFDSCGADDPQGPATAYIYFCKQGDYQAAIVFRVPADSGALGEEAKNMIRLSLASLVLGRNAQEQWRVYRPNKK